MPLHIETPLLESGPLSKAAGRSIWLKLETIQPTGSFKIRGVGLACETYAKQGKKRFLSTSGGNAGIAVAYCGRRIGLPVTIVVPETTTEVSKSFIRAEGAELIVHGGSWSEAYALATSMVDDDVALIHSFDEPLLWDGHATMIDEVACAGFRPDAVIVSVGGGGLLCGVVEGLRRNNMPNVPILAVETIGADSFARSIEAGERVTLPAITSIAVCLGANRVCEQAFNLSRTHPIWPLVVTDKSAVTACQRFLSDHRILVEPACGASLAVPYDFTDALRNYERILLIACGGVGATVSDLQKWSTAWQ
jgi:L-serine/L-threonine ammonia-lyase